MTSNSVISLSSESSAAHSAITPLNLPVYTPHDRVREWICSYEYEAPRAESPVPLLDTNRNEGVCIRYDFHKSSQFPAPLSPNARKHELCSYLQLMKPSERDAPKPPPDTKRRSKRVKNNQRPCELTLLGKTMADVMAFPAAELLDELNQKISTFDDGFRDYVNEYMPLPPSRVYNTSTPFEGAIDTIIEDVKRMREKPTNQKSLIVQIKRLRSESTNRSLRKSTTNKKVVKRMITKPKRKRFNFNVKLRNRSYKATRSQRVLRNVPLLRLMLGTERRRPKNNKVPKEKTKVSEPIRVQEASPTEKVHVTPQINPENNVDLQNFVDDMLELNTLSEEHRKSVIESRILATNTIETLIHEHKEEDVQKAYQIFSDLTNEMKSSDEIEPETPEEIPGVEVVALDHDYVAVQESETESDRESSVEAGELEDVVPIPVDVTVIPSNERMRTMKSLQFTLAANNHRRKVFAVGADLAEKDDDKRVNHEVRFSRHNGRLVKAFYQDYNLVIAQQNAVSFWTQSSLGNILGAQNMWIPTGESQRLHLNSTYIQKETSAMVITTETSLAYVELWTKEHKSEFRELPVADVFVAVYFWRIRQAGIDRKSLQLENIKGFSDDVQYVALREFPRIVVSWRCIQGDAKITKVHCYQLAADFQTVASINEFCPVPHYVKSLHVIEDCENVVMGYGDNKITLWNVEYGYVMTTVDLSPLKPPLSTLWVKSDRGFLFVIQECADQLRLLAVNGINHSWKKLQSFVPPIGFEGLKGVVIENGLLLAYYKQGIVCWNAESGDLVMEVASECEYVPSGKHVIIIVKEQLLVRHSASHLISAEDFS